MSEQTPTYEVGQVVNGHRWNGTTWEPISQEPPPAPPAPPSQGGPAPEEVPTKRPVWKRWWFWALVVLVAIIAIAASTSGSGDTTGQGPAAGGTTSAPSAPHKAGPTTPASPSPAAASPVAQARRAFADTYGSFSPVSKTGHSDAVIRLPSGAKAGIATMTFKGSGNFAVTVLDATNQSTGDLLANEIGSFSGTAAFGLQPLGAEPAKIKVEGQGAWSIHISPVSTAPEITFPAAKKGPGVHLYVGDASDWALTHKGSSNFAVQTTTTDGSNDLLVNEIGNYSGTVAASPGPVLISVTADGSWSIKAAS